MYVLVTVAGKVKHVWGPFDTAPKAKAQGDRFRRGLTTGTLTYSVHKVLDPESTDVPESDD
jgi:hypothetical protein